MILSINSLKGGGGKSTLAYQLATLFARDGFLVCLVDCTYSKTCLRWFQNRNKVTSGVPWVEMCPMLYGSIVNQIKQLRKEFDIVIVDCMTTVENTTQILQLANYTLIPVQCSWPDIDTLEKLRNLIKTVQTDKNSRLKSGIVVNQFDSRTSVDRACYKWLLANCLETFPEVIGQRSAHKETYSRGLGVNELYNLDKIREYRAAAEEMEAFYQALRSQLSSLH